MNFLEKYQIIVSDAIEKYKFTDQPVQLYDPMNYILHLGGKRLRPVIVLMACDLFDGNIEKAVKPALGIEYFHNFSLMHDDIMDQAPLRRGKETVHIKYNESTAILSGDAMMVKSFQMLEDLESVLFKSCFRLFSETAIGVCEGQQYDMNFEKQNGVLYDEYIHMITGKTAVLCACALKMGAMIAETSEENSQKMYEFGKYLGIAFQLMDDFLDVFGDQELVGKQLAGDIYENKKTILYILAMQQGNEEQKKELTYWFGTNKQSEEKIQKVIQLFRNLKVDVQCKELIDTYTRKACEYLNLIQIAEEKKQPLYDLVDYLLVRQK